MSVELAAWQDRDDTGVPLRNGWAVGIDALGLLGHDLAARPAVSLRQLVKVALLDTRVDQKYLVPLSKLPSILERLPSRLAVLDIDGRRTFAYESHYFDSDDFALYRQHVQGRRKRYKVRTRSYCDSFESVMEVKLKGSRGRTVKERVPYDFGCRQTLTAEGRAFLDEVLDRAYGITAPPLGPTLQTGYHRSTLVDLERRTRLTIDVRLRWSDHLMAHRADHLALIETKALGGSGEVDALLPSMSVRPIRVSKYCLGVALLHPGMAANPWNRLLRRQFGWQRAPEA